MGALLLSGCVDDPRIGETSEPLAVQVASSVLPPPTGTDLVAATTPYRIGPLDKLAIAVFGVEDLSGTLQTDAAGKLSMPLAGEIAAAGMTPGELAATIERRLHGYVKDPQVTVNLEETTSQVFTVDGQVTQPGSYPVVGNMSLMRAVATAKGASEFARLDDVVIFRTVAGQQMAALYNLDAIRHGKYADPVIYANDIIVVGDSKSRRLFQQIIQTAPLLATPVVIALQRHH